MDSVACPTTKMLPAVSVIERHLPIQIIFLSKRVVKGQSLHLGQNQSNW